MIRNRFDAKIGIAWIVTEYVAEGWSHVVKGVSISREQDMARADQLLLEALERDRDQPKAYFVLGASGGFRIGWSNPKSNSERRSH